MKQPESVKKKPSRVKASKNFAKRVLPAALMLAVPGLHASSPRSSVSRRGTKATAIVMPAQSPVRAENPFGGFSTQQNLRKSRGKASPQRNVIERLRAKGLLHSQSVGQSILSGQINGKKGGAPGAVKSVSTLNVSCVAGATYNGNPIQTFSHVSSTTITTTTSSITNMVTTPSGAITTATTFFYVTNTFTSSTCSLNGPGTFNTATSSNSAQCAVFLNACNTVPDTTPPAPVITGPVVTQTGAFTATIAFGEVVIGFVLGDIAVANGAASMLVDNGGGNFDVLITPAADGLVTVDVVAAVAADAAGNNNLAAMQFSVLADITAPTPVISGPAATQIVPFSVNVVFGEAVTGFALGDVAVGNGAASMLMDNGGGSFSITVTPGGDGLVTVDVAAGVAADTAGNNNLLATQFGVLADITAPTPVISGPAGTQIGQFSVNIIFGETVAGFALGDIAVGNGAASMLMDNGGGSFSITVTPAADGLVTVDVAAGVAADTAGNNNLLAVQSSVLADITAPTPVISGPAGTQNGPFSVGIVFGEAVAGFALGDIAVGNGAASMLMDNGGGSFSVTITPAADGLVTVDVAAGVAADTAGNNSLLATQFSVLADITAPTPVISGPAGIQIGPFSVNIIFGETVAGFALGDIAVGNGAASILMDNGGGSFSITVTPAADGLVTVDVAAGVAADTAGNSSLLAAQFSVLADITAPTPVISGPAATQIGPFSVNIVFGEAVTGFALADIAIGNGAASMLMDNGGGSYSATITPAADGLVSVDIAAAVAADSAGNDNLVASQFSVLADITAPTPVISGPAATQNGPFSVNIVFGETVTGFVLADIAISNGAASALIDNGGGSFGITVTPAADGLVTVDVAAAVANDTAGNNSLVAVQYSVQANVLGPTPIPTGPNPGPVNAPFPLQVDFGEAVTGFALGDLMVGNGTASNLLDQGGGSFSVTIAPAVDGPVTVDVPAGAAQDVDGNPSLAMAQFSVDFAGLPPLPIPVLGNLYSVFLAGLLGFFGFRRFRGKKKT